MPETVDVQLSEDEALVLFELLSRFESEGRLSAEVEAEELALSRVLAQLEKHLAAPFQCNYRELLDLARNRIEGR